MGEAVVPPVGVRPQDRGLDLDQNLNPDLEADLDLDQNVEVVAVRKIMLKILDDLFLVFFRRPISHKNHVGMCTFLKSTLLVIMTKVIGAFFCYSHFFIIFTTTFCDVYLKRINKAN